MTPTKERTFPIQSQRGAAPHPLLIPWHVAELAYSVYSANYGRGQSLERLAERGGFGPNEMDMFLPGWRDMCKPPAPTLTSEKIEAAVGGLCKKHCLWGMTREEIAAALCRELGIGPAAEGGSK